MRKTRICLLIDDDQDDHEIFALALEECGAAMELLSAFDADEAKAMLRSGVTPRPDYIFLDLNMPRVNGRDLLMELKLWPSLLDIPVIIYSTSSEIIDLLETQKHGAVAFIVKSSSIEELKMALESFFAETEV